MGKEVEDMLPDHIADDEADRKRRQRPQDTVSQLFQMLDQRGGAVVDMVCVAHASGAFFLRGARGAALGSASGAVSAGFARGLRAGLAGGSAPAQAATAAGGAPAPFSFLGGFLPSSLLG